MPPREILTRLEETIRVELAKQDRGRFSHLQNFLYYYFEPLFSYADSVVLLTEKGLYEAAEIILRTMYESHININYHIVGDSERKLAITTRELFDERIKGLNGLRALIMKYPDLESKDSTDLYSFEYIRRTLEHQEIHRNAVLRANRIPNESASIKLRRKAELADDEGDRKGNFGRAYEVEYRLFSHPAHMNLSGLQAFVPSDDEEAIPGAKFSSYCGTAIDICLAYTKDLYDQGVIQTPRHSIIEETKKALSE